MKSRRPNSLRTTLTIWFLLFSLLPLGVITAYSIFQYRQSIVDELTLRGRSNIREFKSVVESYQSEFKVRAKRFVKNRELIYSLAASNVGQARTLVDRWLPEFNGSKMSVIRDDGVFLFSAIKEPGKAPKFYKVLGEDTYELSERVTNILRANQDNLFLTIVSGGYVQLIHNKRIYRSENEPVGYLEQVLILSNDYIDLFAERINSKIFVLDREKNVLASSHKDLLGQVITDFEDPEPILVNGVEHLLFFEKVNWGDDHFFVGLGVSTSAAKRVIDEISFAFLSAAAALVLLLLVLVYFATRSILRPLNSLVDALEGLSEESDDLIQLPVSSSDEVGRLSQSFNNMARKIRAGYLERNEKIKQLEEASRNVRNTQTQLVQSAKMASLGQLVAGVAHELNNPIGYISSNMSFLKDYVQRLCEIIDSADGSLDEKKKSVDYEFIKADLEKLIKAYEEGAERTREIVLGLRNFSRLDDMKLAPVNINEGIENTLLLLESELKGRVQVNKKFADLPEVICFASAVNQVFMNIIQNAIQAIQDSGSITIESKVKESFVEVVITDTGVGMSQETQSKIFDPFFTTKSVGEGTGLGMSISFGIIHKHDGKIEVESEVGKGTTFIVSLPIDGPQGVSG